MKANVWAKTLLRIYRYLERITDALDRLIETKALGSFYVSTTTSTANGVSVIANKIIELSGRKVTLINTKLLIEEALRKMEIEKAAILIERYIDGDKAQDIAARHMLSKRTYFRRLQSAEIAFGQQLCLLGYSESKLEGILSEEKWILEVHRQFTTQEREPDIDVRSLQKMAVS